jgi:hypothetical protein
VEKVRAQKQPKNLPMKSESSSRTMTTSRLEIAASDKRLAVSRKYAEVAPAPILHLHRHEDGYIAFATERDGEDFRPLVSIKASELETWFPAWRDLLLKDAYVGINADLRVRKYGPHGAAYGYPLHRSDRLRYLNACYVDIDFQKLGLDLGTVIGRVINLQESGQLPHASMIVRSGNGIWLLWLIHDIKAPDISQRAFPDKLELYSRIQNAIIERLLPLGADMAARDAARHLRIPGSLNSGAEKTVEWWIQGEGNSGYVYTLPELAKLFKAIPTRRHHGELVAHNPAKRRGWVALNARRLRDFNALRWFAGRIFPGMPEQRGQDLRLAATLQCHTEIRCSRVVECHGGTMPSAAEQGRNQRRLEVQPAPPDERPDYQQLAQGHTNRVRNA